MFASKKPYTAISVQIEHLTTEQYEENDLVGLPELIEAVRLQDSGPQEAARAIRKKLKYGNIHRQARALTLLDALVENAGKRFQRSFADEPLLERLRIIGSDSMTDPDVKKKAQILYAQWASAYKDDPTMKGITSLYRQMPTRPRAKPAPRPVSPDDDASPPPAANGRRGSASASAAGHSRNSSFAGPSHSRSNSAANKTPITLGASNVTVSSSPKSKDKNKNKTQKRPPFDFEKEKSTMIQNIASASIAATNLKNALKLINRENERVSDNEEVMKRFDVCKQLRRQILRYIQFVESEQWLGGLIHANDELVEALTLFEMLDKPPGVDSDSEGEWEKPPPEAMVDDTAGRMGKLKIVGGGAAPQSQYNSGQVPPKPRDYDSDDLEDASDDEPEDPNDPFGDSHALKTPAKEKTEPRWAVV